MTTLPQGWRHPYPARRARMRDERHCRAHSVRRTFVAWVRERVSWRRWRGWRRLPGTTSRNDATRSCATSRCSATARYFLEEVGPELRQYIVTSNTEERPFNRDQRRWIYASSKQGEQLLRVRHQQGPRDLAELPHRQAFAVPVASPLPGDDDYDDRYRDPRREGDSAPRAAGPRRSGRRRSSTCRR